MNPKWLKLAGDLLHRAADQMGNAGCNDWQWPADWTREERREFATALVAENVRKAPAELGKDELAEVRHLTRGKEGPPDWWVARFLAKQMGGQE
jgi:hypothetical protein